MKTVNALILYYYILGSSFSNAFIVNPLSSVQPPPILRTESMQRQTYNHVVVHTWTIQRTSTNICHLSTTEMNDGNTNKLKIDHQSSEEDSWQLYLQSRDVQEVRQELIEKYLSLGRSQEYAETEIDKFLNDPSRSQKFLEMKKYVKSQEDASMGFENFLLYGGAFFVGLLGDAIFKYIVALQEEITSDHIDLFHFPS